MSKSRYRQAAKRCFIINKTVKGAFLIALGFLTRIPVAFVTSASVRQKSDSLLFYPLVGGIIGVLVLCLILLFDALETSVGGHFSPMFYGVLGVAFWVWLTGALHLDGLADCADAWVGGRDRASTLRIMKDPSAGPIAVVVLVLVLLMKAVLLAELIRLSLTLELVFVPVIARAYVLVLFMTTTYANPGGLGQVYQVGLNEKQRAYRYRCYALIATTLFGFIVLGWNLIWLLVASALVAFWLRRSTIGRLGGFTGDVAGAMVELIELTLCLVLLVLYG